MSHSRKEASMRGHLLMITIAASILVFGSVVVSAQDDTDTPNMQQLEQAQQDAADQAGPAEGGHGMMRRCMRQCMGGDNMMSQRVMRHSMR